MFLLFYCFDGFDGFVRCWRSQRSSALAAFTTSLCTFSTGTSRSWSWRPVFRRSICCTRRARTMLPSAGFPTLNSQMSRLSLTGPRYASRFDRTGRWPCKCSGDCLSSVLVWVSIISEVFDVIYCRSSVEVRFLPFSIRSNQISCPLTTGSTSSRGLSRWSSMPMEWRIIEKSIQVKGGWWCSQETIAWFQCN